MTLCVLVAVSAGATEPLRVLVLESDGTDPALVERLRGQTIDLAVELSVRGTNEWPEAPEAQVARAFDLARADAADVVVWFRRPDPARDVLTVCVAELGEGQLLVRQLGEGEPAEQLVSSTQEAAGVVVREALRAVLAGVEIGGTPPPEAEPAPRSPPVVPAPAAPPPLPADHASPPPPHRVVRPQLEAGLGWAAVVAVPAGQGPMASLGLHQGGGVLALLVMMGLPATREQELATIRLSRHLIGLRVGGEFEATPRLRLGLGARGGVLGYFRRTVETAPQVAGTPAQFTPSGLLGVDLVADWLPEGPPWGLRLAIGLDVVPQGPEITIARAGEPVILAEPAFLQPGLGLGVRWRAEKSGAPSH